MPLINCKVSLTLTESKNCVLTDMTTRVAIGDNLAIAAPTNVTFKINGTKLYAQVVRLSSENDNKPLEQLKTGLNTDLKYLIRLKITI